MDTVGQPTRKCRTVENKATYTPPSMTTTPIRNTTAMPTTIPIPNIPTVSVPAMPTMLVATTPVATVSVQTMPTVSDPKPISRRQTRAMRDVTSDILRYNYQIYNIYTCDDQYYVEVSDQCGHLLLINCDDAKVQGDDEILLKPLNQNNSLLDQYYDRAVATSRGICIINDNTMHVRYLTQRGIVDNSYVMDRKFAKSNVLLPIISIGDILCNHREITSLASEFVDDLISKQVSLYDKLKLEFHTSASQYIDSVSEVKQLVDDATEVTLVNVNQYRMYTYTYFDIPPKNAREEQTYEYLRAKSADSQRDMYNLVTLFNRLSSLTQKMNDINRDLLEITNSLNISIDNALADR